MQHRHFILYKPYGYLSQFVGEAPKKKRLGELYDFPAGTMAVGRLDEDSEGLLLLTTDGKLSQYLTSAQTEKEYYVQVDGVLTDAAVAQLQAGVNISLQGQPYITKPCTAVKLPAAPSLPARARPVRHERHGPTSWVAITLTEGKNRQIRKMTAAVGFPTLRLVRVRVGLVALNQLQPGEVKEMAAFTFVQPISGEATPETAR